MHKDSLGHIGFQFKEGKIVALVKDSSAARNGLLIDHHILEINGKVHMKFCNQFLAIINLKYCFFQNVIGKKDKEISVEIEKGGDIITLTIIPSYIYDHMIKKLVL